MIKTENLTKKFDNFTALNGISCTIPSGSIYGMVGSNGAGKSTFLRVLNGIYKADKGTVFIDDCNVYENVAVKEKISFVPDSLYFLPGANLNRMASLYQNTYTNFDMEFFNKLTGIFKLNPKKNLGKFSKGMKKQAAIILALACHPEYMFFDETFDGLDPVMRNLVKGLIMSEVAERNCTVIITSHSLRELEDLCDQLALLHKGGLVLESDIENLKTRQFKLQVAFDYEYDESLFAGISHFNFTKTGSVSSMIVNEDKDIVTAKVEGLNPILLDILPLSLEEVFTYEMDALGYNFENALEDDYEK